MSEQGARTSKPNGPQVLRVADVVLAMRDLVERAVPNVWVEGEIVEISRSSTAHLFFTLADGKDAGPSRVEATLKCVVFATDRAGIGCEMVLGARVRVRGHGTIYAPQSSLRLVVERVLSAGLGERAEKLAKLREKLRLEGLFDPSRKRALPLVPRVIGLVTSKQGAAFHDVVRVALARSPVRIVLAHCTVQGPDAARSIMTGMEALARMPDLDVLVVARGGGASDDLSAFDDERVVRAIAAFPVPVVSGVGHETDVTLADLAADVRAATPSNAAELVVPERDALRAELDQSLRRLQARFEGHVQGRRLALERMVARLADRRGPLRARRDVVRQAEHSLERSMQRALERDRKRLASLSERLARSDPRRALEVARGRLTQLAPRLDAAMRTGLASARDAHTDRTTRSEAALRSQIESARRELAMTVARVDAMSPLAVLSRGYAIALDARGRAVTRADAVAVGERIEVRVQHGTLTTRVEGRSDGS